MAHIWFYEIDWGNTAAGFSALVAAGVAGWTAWWSLDTRRRECLAVLGNARLVWIEKFRADLAEFMGNTNVTGAHFIANRTGVDYPDDQKSRHLALYHRLLMDLPVDMHHLAELRRAIYNVLQDHADVAALQNAIHDLQFVATAAFATERHLALIQLSGKKLPNDGS